MKFERPRGTEGAPVVAGHGAVHHGPAGASEVDTVHTVAVVGPGLPPQERAVAQLGHLRVGYV